tara:strand:+ start:350 stop:571 length:222 start_codon:yes stop_codon:yes gene_type:complete
MKTAINIANIGFVKLIAIASLIGIMLDAPNKILTPNQPENDLRKCSLKFGLENLIFLVIKIVKIIKKANKNLE